MKFVKALYSQLHFPRLEWSWLRPASLVDLAAPDTFVWGVEVDGKLWAWSIDGSDLASPDPAAEIPVLVLECRDELEAFGLYLKTSFEAQAPLEVEWVHALSVLESRFHYDLAKHGLPPYWGQTLQAQGLEAHLGILIQRARFGFLSFEEKHFLFEKRWDPATFEILESWPLDLRKTFLTTIKRWPLSASQTKEAAGLLVTLHKKLGAEGTQAFLKRPFQSPEDFRQQLHFTAQPEFASLSAQRVEKLRALRLPPRTSVFGDPTFESDILKITHTPRSVGDFLIFKAWVEDPELERKLAELLEVYRC